MVKKVVWTAPAQKQLEKAYEYILERSYQNAEKVKEDILASTRKLAEQPEAHPPDKYRRDNNGSFRAYELLISESLTNLLTRRSLLSE
jgi:plasmid stabilization system protein ParE